MYAHVGHVYFNDHSSSPLVIGDFQAMKRWPGSPDGSDGFTRFKSGKGAIFDLQLASPEVFVRSPRALALLAPLRRTGWSLEERFGRAAADLEPALTADLEQVWHDDEILVESSAIVISIAYNATPEIGAEAHADADIPRLPREAPTRPHYQSEPVRAHELAIVPLDNGWYRIRIGQLTVDGDPVGRCTLDWLR